MIFKGSQLLPTVAWQPDLKQKRIQSVHSKAQLVWNDSFLPPAKSQNFSRKYLQVSPRKWKKSSLMQRQKNPKKPRRRSSLSNRMNRKKQTSTNASKALIQLRWSHQTPQLDVTQGMLWGRNILNVVPRLKRQKTKLINRTIIWHHLKAQCWLQILEKVGKEVRWEARRSLSSWAVITTSMLSNKTRMMILVRKKLKQTNQVFPETASQISTSMT